VVNISDKHELQRVLVSLRQRVNDIDGCSIVSRDGLVIVSELMADVDTKTFAALSADVTRSGEVVVGELRIGTLSQIIIGSTGSNIITTNIGKKAILVCMVHKNANMGFVLLHMNRSADYLEKVLGKVGYE